MIENTVITKSAGISPFRSKLKYIIYSPNTY